MRSFVAQKLIALSLVVFLSGTCCLLCCKTMKAAASGTAESCPLSKGHHCPTKSGKPNLTQAASAGAGQAEKCCPFISKRSDLARKTEIDHKASVSAPVRISLPEFFLAGDTTQRSKIYHSVVRNRGSTYLNNCVFRI